MIKYILSYLNIHLLFPLAIVLTTATQLRSSNENTPVGLGELLLLVWIIVSFKSIFKKHPKSSSPLIFFWILTPLLLTIGSLVSLAKGVITEQILLRNALAYILAGFSCVLFLKAPNLPNRYKQAMYLVPSFLVSAHILFLFLPGFSNAVGIDPFFGEFRFTGWSRNPNQLALAFCLIPFMCLINIQQTSYKLIKILFGFMMIVSLFIGLATGSDGLRFSWVLGSIIISLWVIYKSINSSDNSVKGFLRRLLYIAFSIAIILTLYVLYDRFDFLGYASDIAQSGDQDAIRYTLWKNGIEAAMESYFIGLGPGSFSGLSSHFEEWEAHNSFVDWLTNAGIIGLLSLCFLYLVLMKRYFRSKQIILFSACFVLLVSSFFNFYLRHPIFWYFMSYLYLYSYVINELNESYNSESVSRFDYV